MCFNADGNRNNDFANREGKPVSTAGNYFTRYYNRGSKWQVDSDDDKTICRFRWNLINDYYQEILKKNIYAIHTK